MTEQIVEGVNPTRMELLEIRKKLELAEKGHKLLEEKRDALVERFFNVIDRRNSMKQEVDGLFTEAFSSLVSAQMIMGEQQVQNASYLIEDIGEVSFDEDNIMGVRIPHINVDNIQYFYLLGQNKDRTAVSSLFDDYHNVKETPEQILELIDGLDKD